MNKIIADKRNILIVALVVLALQAVFQHGVLLLWWLLGGVAFSALLDFVIAKFFYRKAILPKSAAITGFIVAGILSYNISWFWAI